MRLIVIRDYWDDKNPRRYANVAIPIDSILCVRETDDGKVELTIKYTLENFYVDEPFGEFVKRLKLLE